ncbi:DNA repair protein rhp57, partial [Elasticomyces elasticus]
MSKSGLASQQSHPGATLLSEDPLALDHQQRWISGWGDTLHAGAGAMKTPSLGLAWSKQVAARVALLKRPVYKNGTDASSLGVVGEGGGGGGGGEKEIVGWAREMKVVFAAWAPPSLPGVGVAFEIARAGIRSVGLGGEEEGDG